MKERIQKILSARGVCSRRAAEDAIRQGRVRVNGIVASIGDTAGEEDVITLDGAEVPAQSQLVYIMLNKPRGYVTTLSDEAGRPDIRQLIRDVPCRVYPVGRLDMHSEGLLLLTNDGALANTLTHPSHEVYKQYLVRLTYDGPGQPAEPPELALSRPLTVDGQALLPAKCRLVQTLEDGYILTMSIREGKNRQIRRMCTACGYTVNALKRVAEGNIKLGDLKSGAWRYLTTDEIEYLKSIK